MAEKKTKAKKPVVNSKKADKKTWQVVALFLLIAFFVVSLLFLWLYASNKPNYRDLEKAYNKLNIPSDWQLVSQSSNKGLWGMFCSSGVSDTSPCPIINKRFTSERTSNQTDINNIEKLLNGYSNGFDINLSNCVNPNDETYYCIAKGSKNNIGLIVSVGNDKDNNKTIDVQLGPRNALGL